MRPNPRIIPFVRQRWMTNYTDGIFHLTYFTAAVMIRASMSASCVNLHVIFGYVAMRP